MPNVRRVGIPHGVRCNGEEEPPIKDTGFAGQSYVLYGGKCGRSPPDSDNPRDADVQGQLKCRAEELRERVMMCQNGTNIYKYYRLS